MFDCIDAASFQIQTSKALQGNDSSLFAVRTEDSSALQYFQVGWFKFYYDGCYLIGFGFIGDNIYVI
jgi:hypothetical protein